MSPAFLLFALAAAPADHFPPGELTEKITCRTDPTQTYTLYLPSRYSPQRRWPVLLIFDPRGRATLAAGIFRDAAERYGWILLSSDNTRSDGPFEPNARAVTALWAELASRYPADERRLYATGFSGGAIVAWLLGQKTGALAGVIGCGGHINPGVSRETFTFAHFGAAGETDFNYGEMRKVDAILEAKGLPHRLEVFPGDHSWLPTELATAAVAWMEVTAVKQGRREPDAALVEAVYAADVARAQALGRDRPAEAFRRWQAIARTFDGLRAVAEAKRNAAALGADADRAIKDEQRWEDFERRYLERELLPPLAAIRNSETPLPVPRLLSDLRIAELQDRGRRPTYEGTVARRILEALFSQVSFYLTRDLLEHKLYARAVLALRVASAIKPGDPVVLYNLACALALSGRKPEALQSLDQAIAHGFRDRRQIEADADLQSLRGDEAYSKLLSQLP